MQINKGGVEDAVYEDVPQQDVVVKPEMAVIHQEDALRQELAPYQDGLPFDKDRIRNRICANGRNLLENMINIGIDLIWAKEELGHGNFYKWLEFELKMPHQRAGELMRIARRVIESKTPDVRRFLQLLSKGSISKMFLFMDVTDEEIEEILETGTFLGRKLDEISSMGYRQLQEAIRKDRDQLGDVKKERDDLKWKLKKAEAALDEAKNKTDDPINPKDPPSILGRHFSAVLAVLGQLETVAIEFADEVDDKGLMVPKTRDMISSYIGTFNQKITHLYQILTPNEIRDVRLHILPAPKPPEEKDAE